RHMPPGPQQEPRRDLVRGLTKRHLVVDLIGEDVIAHRAPLPRHPLALALRLRLRLVLAHADSFRTHSGGPLPAPALAPAAAALSTYQRRCTPGSARPAAPAPAPTHRSGSNALPHPSALSTGASAPAPSRTRRFRDVPAPGARHAVVRTLRAGRRPGSRSALRGRASSPTCGAARAAGATDT